MKLSTRVLTESGLCIALSLLLGMIVFWRMPQGGSIHAAHMVPLLLLALRRGPKVGMLGGLTYGLLHFLLGAKYSLHPLSIILDYLLAYAALGLAGYAKEYSRASALVWSTLAMFGRYVLTVLSGAIVFGSYAPAGMNPWWYSITYNATVIPPDAIINLVVLALIYAPIMRIRR